MLAHRERAELAQRLIRETCAKRDVAADQLTLHSDRGPAMQSQTVAQLLATLGVVQSHSRPRVSNDNPFPESQFKTLKYRPDVPSRFASFDEALAFCREFFPWYNDACSATNRPPGCQKNAHSAGKVAGRAPPLWRGTPGEMAVEPGPGECPVPIGGAGGNAENLRRLLQHQAGEVVQAHQLNGGRVDLLEGVQGLVDGQCLLVRRLTRQPRLGNLDLTQPAAVFDAAFAAGIFHQDSPHGLRRGGEDVAAAGKCCTCSTATSRRYASWTSAVACSVCPGDSRDSFSAASFRSSS
jgi:hypothetical protein